MLGFDVAIQMVKGGDCAARKHWPDKMRIYMKLQREEVREFIVLDDPGMQGLMPWSPTHEDLLSDDWECVNGPEDG